PILDPMIFAIAEEANHNPKINPTNFLGDNLLTQDSPTGDKQSSPVVWKKYAAINQIILTDAVAAPCGISLLPYAKTTKPIPKRKRPMANFTGPDGFHTFSQILLNTAAKVIIKNEFKIWNQEATTSVSKAVNSLIIFQSPKYQIITKLIDVAIIVAAYLLNNFFAKPNNTAVTIINGN